MDENSSDNVRQVVWPATQLGVGSVLHGPEGSEGYLQGPEGYLHPEGYHVQWIALEGQSEAG